MPFFFAPKPPVKFIATGIQFRGAIKGMPLEPRVVTNLMEVTIFAVTMLTDGTLDAIVSTDNTARTNLANAATCGHPSAWQLDMIVLRCNERPYLTVCFKRGIVWRPYVIVGRCVHTGATLEVQAYPCQNDSTSSVCLRDVWPNDATSGTELFASSRINCCITPDCTGNVWGSEQMCPACTMKYDVL